MMAAQKYKGMAILMHNIKLMYGKVLSMSFPFSIK
jgi:hypothetical protein